MPVAHPCPDWKLPILVRFRGEDQKIIHPIAFHEILEVVQFESGLGSFANDHVFTDAVILPVALAINDANLRSWFERQAKITEQRNRMGYLMVGLEQQHGINAVGRKVWVVRLAEDRIELLPEFMFTT